MSLRTSLIISYLFLVITLTVGMWFVADHFLDRLTDKTQVIAEIAVQRVTAANIKVAEKVLTHYGEYVVRDKAEDAARELAQRLGGRKSYDYAALRRVPGLRKVAIQTISTPEGAAGYTDAIGRARPALPARWATGSAGVVMCWVKMPMNDSPWNDSEPAKHSYMMTPIA